MRSKRGQKGAISVFLSIILVPCIVVSSVFVDLGRVHLSKTMAESSADLALNSLLTNYDADLKDWYGMVASCQNIQEFYEVSAQYFLRTISSQNLSDEEIILLSDYYSSATNDDTIYDLLSVECEDGTSGMIQEVTGANLSNPALLKEQIVEFMKYRAPVELAESLFSMIKNEDGSPSDQAEELIKSDENDDLVEAKQNFYEAEGDLLTAAFYTYWAIRDYYDNAQKLGYSNEKLKEYMTQINNIKTAYAYIHNVAVSNLLNTDALTGVYIRVNMPLDKYNSTYTKESQDVYSRKETKEGTTTYYIDGADITDLLDKLEEEIEDFDEAKENFSNGASGLMGKLPGAGDYESNAVQWWVQMNNAVNAPSGEGSHTIKLDEAANNMLKAYSKVLAMKECTLGKDIPEDWETRFTDLTTKVEDRQQKYLEKDVTNNGDAYLKAVKQLEVVSSANINVIRSYGAQVTVDGKTMSVDAAISYASTQMSKLKGELEDRIAELDDAIDGDGDKVKSLSKLKALAETYDSTFDTWSGVANNTHTNMGDDDREYIEGITLERQINRESVTELETRLKNIRSQLKELLDGINSMKYGNKKIAEIKDFSTFKSQALTQVSTDSIALMNKDIDNYAGNTFGKLFSPTGSSVVTLDHLSENSHNPDINPEEGNRVDTPDLLEYMHKQFKETSEDKFSDAEKDKDDAQGEKDDYVEQQKNAVSKYRGGGTNIPREYSEGYGYSSGTALLATTVELFKNIIEGNYGSIRDDIYVTTYMVNMFSYATYDYEGQYELLSAEDRKNLTPSTAPQTYKEKVEGSATEPHTWLSTDVQDSYNKSLTNKMIEKSTHAAYLAELEYILYGKDTNEKNVKDAFGEIYALRFLLNTVSAFQNFWTSSDKNNTTALAINAVAGAISIGFGGVIPPSVIKAVMLPIYAAVETCMDNSRLSNGMPVELYKTSHEDWWISIGGRPEGYGAFFENLKNGTVGAGKNQDEGFFYSDYLTVFIYAGLSGGGDLEEDMYRRMAEVIQVNMRHMEGEGSTYSMKLSRVYFQLHATLRVKPLMVTLPIFNDYDNNMDTARDWCTYEVTTVRGY